MEVIDIVRAEPEITVKFTANELLLLTAVFGNATKASGLQLKLYSQLEQLSMNAGIGFNYTDQEALWESVKL